MDRIQLFIFLLPHHQGTTGWILPIYLPEPISPSWKIVLRVLFGLFRRYQPLWKHSCGWKYKLSIGSWNNRSAGVPLVLILKVVVPTSKWLYSEVIASGGSASLTSTCCATNPGDPGSCPPGNQKSQRYGLNTNPVLQPKQLKLHFANGTMSGVIAVEVFVWNTRAKIAQVVYLLHQMLILIVSMLDQKLLLFVVKTSTTSIYVKVE